VGKIHVESQPAGDGFVAGKLTSIVESLGSSLVRIHAAHCGVQRLVDTVGQCPVEAAGNGVTACPFDIGKHMSASPFSDHGVALPVAQPVAVIDDGGAFIDAHAIGNLAAFGRLSIGFSAFFVGYAKVLFEVFSPLVVAPYPSVNCGM